MNNGGPGRSPFVPPGGGRPQGPPPGGPFGQGPFAPAGAPQARTVPGYSAPPAPAQADLTPVGPPTALLVASGVLAAAGIAIGALFWAQWQSLIGWLLAGPIAIGVVALFSSKDTMRRTSAVYLRPGWIMGAYVAVMVLVAAGVLVGAFGFAIWVGRR